MDTWSLKPIQEELALTGSFERFLLSFQNMFTSSANLQAFLLDFHDIIRPQHDFFCRNRGKKRLKIDWRVKIKCSGCYTFTYSLRFFVLLWPACCLLPWKTDRHNCFQIFHKFWSIFGGNCLKFPSKYMKFPFVTFSLFSDQVRQKKFKKWLFGKHSCWFNFSRKLKEKTKILKFA